MTITTEIYAFLLVPAALYPVALGVLQAHPVGAVARIARNSCRVIGAVAILGTLSAFLAAGGLGNRSISSTAGAMWFLFAGAFGVGLVFSALRVKAGTVTDGRILRRVLAVPVIGFCVLCGTTEVRGLTRRVNSSLARGYLQRMIRAQREYAKDNGGYFDRLSCLVGEPPCRTGRRVSYISIEDLAPSGDGYRRAFHPGPDVPRSEIERTHASPTSLHAFAFAMEPESQDTGIEAYCGQSDGLICSRWMGKVPKPVLGRCVQEKADTCRCLEGALLPDGSCPPLQTSPPKD